MEPIKKEDSDHTATLPVVSAVSDHRRKWVRKSEITRKYAQWYACMLCGLGSTADIHLRAGNLLWVSAIRRRVKAFWTSASHRTSWSTGYLKCSGLRVPIAKHKIILKISNGLVPWGLLLYVYKRNLSQHFGRDAFSIANSSRSRGKNRNFCGVFAIISHFLRKIDAAPRVSGRGEEHKARKAENLSGCGVASHTVRTGSGLAFRRMDCYAMTRGPVPSYPAATLGNHLTETN